MAAMFGDRLHFGGIQRRGCKRGHPERHRRRTARVAALSDAKRRLGADVASGFKVFVSTFSFSSLPSTKPDAVGLARTVVGHEDVLPLAGLEDVSGVVTLIALSGHDSMRCTARAGRSATGPSRDSRPFRPSGR